MAEVRAVPMLRPARDMVMSCALFTSEPRMGSTKKEPAYSHCSVVSGFGCTSDSMSARKMRGTTILMPTWTRASSDASSSVPTPTVRNRVANMPGFLPVRAAFSRARRQK